MKFLLLSFISIFYFLIASGQTNNQNSSAGITIDLPLINNAGFYSYGINGTGENVNQTGYLGSGFAFFYAKNRNKFSLGYENPSANKSLFPPKGNNQNITLNIFEAMMHRKISSQFAVTGGINYATYHYYLHTDFPPFTKIDKKDETLGLSAGAEFVPVDALSVSATYRPSVFCFDKKAYRAIFSLALKYDINFWKKK